jgi:dihydroneopterin aldolase
MFDHIRVIDLEVWSKIGVPDEEREKPQRLLVSLELRVKDIGPAAHTDNVKLTIDYAVVVQRVKSMAELRPRKLIESFAEEISVDLLRVFPISSLLVEIKKFVLPDARYVSVAIERPKGGRSPAAYRPGLSTSLRMSAKGPSSGSLPGATS